MYGRRLTGTHLLLHHCLITFTQLQNWLVSFTYAKKSVLSLFLFLLCVTFLPTSCSLSLIVFCSYIFPLHHPSLRHICSSSHLLVPFRLLSFSLPSKPTPFSPQLSPHFLLSLSHHQQSASVISPFSYM